MNMGLCCKRSFFLRHGAQKLLKTFYQKVSAAWWGRDGKVDIGAVGVLLNGYHTGGFFRW